MAIEPTLEHFCIGETLQLDPCPGWPRRAWHRFTREQAIAVLAAHAIKRPLLVTGEPGIGKTQLARAAAQQLKMPLASLVVNERTEPEDLKWSYDALRRLADAHAGGKGVDDPKRYLRPGPLWWALNPGTEHTKDNTAASYWVEQENGAPYRGERDQAGTYPRDYGNGVLVLVDEIDKAERSVPNSLLDVLGDYAFQVPQIPLEVRCAEGQPQPLILITSNGEQELPPAFIRRCLVLNLELPTDKEKFVAQLAERGSAALESNELPQATLEKIAEDLWHQREPLIQSNASWLPGQAEYLDHLLALAKLKRLDLPPDAAGEDLQIELGRLTYAKNTR